MNKLKRLIQKLFTFFIILIVNFACATTNKNSPADQVGHYKDQFITCKNYIDRGNESTRSP
jgi:hypothetical protein